MDITLITATAATLGSFVGGGASIATTWITQRTQSIRSHAEWKVRERESLYNQFITEASRLAIDALTNSLARPYQLLTLYGILCCIRLISDQEIVRQGEACCRRIVELYGQPNLTADELRAAVAADAINELDPLKEFSKACRDELLRGTWEDHT